MMNIRLSTGFAVLGCVLLASCYPYKENPKHQKTTKSPDKTAVTPDPKKTKDQDALKEKEQEDLAKDQTTENPDSLTPPTEKPAPPTEQPKRDYPTAQKVPGKENYVLSPYNNKLIRTLNDDGTPQRSGQLVSDPSYPISEKKFFRVP